MEANRALRCPPFFFPRAMTDVRERGVGYVPALAHKDPRSGFVALQQRLRHARVASGPNNNIAGLENTSGHAAAHNGRSQFPKSKHGQCVFSACIRRDLLWR